LLRQPGVDRTRIGFVGHDYGAMYGTVAIALHGGVRTAVYIAPTSSLNDWAFFLKQPDSLDAYLAQQRPLELTDHLRATQGVSTFMQFAEQDKYVPLPKADEFFAAANEPKKKRVYAGASHAMTEVPEIHAERTAWLRRELGLNPSTSAR
jgi:pimeloyl-ACP methyl ester carboxylesterase